VRPEAIVCMMVTSRHLAVKGVSWAVEGEFGRCRRVTVKARPDCVGVTWNVLRGRFSVTGAALPSLTLFIQIIGSLDDSKTTD
jgi:hypothetical protein